MFIYEYFTHIFNSKSVKPTILENTLENNRFHLTLSISKLGNWRYKNEENAIQCDARRGIKGSYS